MENQAEKMVKNDPSVVMDLQKKFSLLTADQKQTVASYLNAYNLAAWIFNELLDDQSREYVDLSMKYVMETQKLDDRMNNVENEQDVQILVNDHNHGE